MGVRNDGLVRRKLHKRSFGQIDRGPLGMLVFSARKQRRLTQADLALAIGRDRPWLSDVETGKITHVADDDLHALANALSAVFHDLARARERLVLSSRTSATPRPPLGLERACQTCVHPAAWDASYCVNCGRVLAEEIACATCGRSNAAPAAYCAYCGSRLLVRST